MFQWLLERKNPRRQPAMFAAPNSEEIAEQEIPERRSAETSPFLGRFLFHTPSYKVLWCSIGQETDLAIDVVLFPTRKEIEDALQARDDRFSRLASSYFENTETTTELFLILHRNIWTCRYQFKPLQNLFCDLPLGDTDDSSTVSQSQCQVAYKLFDEFDRFDNPFISASYDDVCNMFSRLHLAFANGLVESRSSNQRSSQPSARYPRAFSARLMTPVARQCTCLKPGNPKRNEITVQRRMATAIRGFLTVKNELDSILKLVEYLRSKVEAESNLVRMVLNEGPEADRRMMIEIMKMINKNRDVLDILLNELLADLCLSLKRVNEARKLLFQEIKAYRLTRSSPMVV